MKFIIRSIIALCFLCFSTVSLHAITVDGTAPQVTVYVGGVENTTATNTLQTAINYAFSGSPDSVLSRAQSELAKFHDQPELAKGFANANAYAAQAATFQGFQDYSIFAVTTGIMVGVQLPSLDPDYYDDIDKKIEEKADIYAGIGTGFAMINAGVNAGFLYPGLYLNLKFGHFSSDYISSDDEDIRYKSTLFGIGANYSWIRTKSLVAGLVKWRGVSFGTGFLYNKNKVDLDIELDPITQSITTINIPPYTFTGDVIIDPSVTLGIHSTTYTIPFDVTTSVRLLWALNFNLGAGIDFNFGSSDIIVKSDGSVTADIPSTTGTSIEVEPGTFIVDGSTNDVSPSFLHARITSGLGLNILPVKIDVPVIFYPFDSAFAVGLTAGFVW